MGVKRKAITKKLRFEIFKRDGFTCQYCGANPPKVILEVDHIIPVSEDGDNQEDNLVTACFSCNRGKSNAPLNMCADSIAERTDRMKEAEKQLSEYRKEKKKLKKKRLSDAGMVNDTYSSFFPKYLLSDHFINKTVIRFLESLDVSDLVDAMTISCSKFSDPDDNDGSTEAIKYFCGICWNCIKNNTTPSEAKRYG